MSAIVYAFATTPEIAGKTVFVILTVILASRPIAGLTQTLHKIGCEEDERVSAYLFIAISFNLAYTLLIGTVAYTFIGFISQYTVIEQDLLVPALLLLSTQVPNYLLSGILGAIGKPGYKTWVTATRDCIKIGFLVLFPSLVTTVEELILIAAATKLFITVPLFVYFAVTPTIPTRREIHRAYEYAKWSVPDQILDRVSYNMPTLVLGIVATPFAVGVYEAADRFADFGANISVFISSVLLTKVSKDWSKDDASLEYVDSAVTGGIGVTFVVVGYLIPIREVISQIAFSKAPDVFSVVVILVGVVNIIRGFWTLVSFVMEGVNQPNVSFKTKIYGLIVSVPATVVLGSEFGAIGGAVGYGIMNGVIFAYVVWFSYSYFERVLINWNVLKYFVLSMIATILVTELAVSLLLPLVGSVSVSVIGVIGSIITYGGCMYVISPKARHVIRKSYSFYIKERLPFSRV